MARRTRTYTVTDKARAQRRGAAWKHGLYAETTLRQVLPPCRRGTCPLGAGRFPCDVRVTMDKQDEALERCPLPLVVDQDVAERLAAAIAEGDPSKIAEIQGTALAAAIHIRDRGLAQLLRDGLSIEIPVAFNESGQPTAHKAIQHPSAWPVMELLKHTGATADQQAITPKSRAERDRDVSVADALNFMATKRKQLEEADRK